jgi:predicted phage baseplate assembly protein
MLPEILLDDVRFQELVSEARTRIVRHAPEWTEHNVSDPGITLIELYAWLTELLVYRINRIPDRLHFGLLALVGIEPRPPECASVPIRFMLDQPGGGGVVPAGTEIASPRTAGSESVVFQTAFELVVPDECTLATYGVQRKGARTQLAKDGAGGRGPSHGVPDELQAPFGSPATAGDALLLGFDSAIAGLVLELRIESSRAEGSVNPGDPPLQWEASVGGDEWEPAIVVSDETGGFTYGGGAISVQVPEAAAQTGIEGVKRHWLRCRVTDRGHGHHDRGVYTASPEITSVEALVAGATVEAYHAATVTGELLGTSEGIPGAAYPLPRHPVLAAEAGEVVEVRELGSDEWVAWQQVESFEHSGRFDRHFQLDTARGEVRFGPAIRQPDGGWRRYGAVPQGGAVLRMSRYRHGGGSDGNVAPRALSILPRPVTGIESATNPVAAVGGVEPESLDSARERARLEIRARTRAVTTEDFERLTLAASPRVARAVCVGPDEPGRPVRVHVLPRVEPADRLLEAEELIPEGELMAELAATLDEYRLLGTSLKLLPVRLRGVSIVADVRASPRSDLDRVQHDVAHALYVYLNPLIGGSPAGPAEGWPLGRSLNQGELFGIVYGIPGVEFVNILRMYETNVRTGEQAPQPTESRLVLAPDELIASGRHIVKASHRE